MVILINLINDDKTASGWSNLKDYFLNNVENHPAQEELKEKPTFADYFINTMTFGNDLKNRLDAYKSYINVLFIALCIANVVFYLHCRNIIWCNKL